jgi:hypothetical protein
MNHKEIYDILPPHGEFNSTDLNRLLGDKMVLESKHDTIPYKTYYKWSIDTEAILSEMRDKGMLGRNAGVHCNWYVKNWNYESQE